MEEALRLAGRSEPVLRFRDDLSCGPIDPDEPAVREAWWSTVYDSPEVEAELQQFWQHAMTTEDHLVFWFGRHSARELALFHSFADRMGERPYDIIDVTGLQWPRTWPPGATGLTEPAASVSIVPTDRLLFGSERPIADLERDEAARHWRKLKRENAPFRVVTSEGLVSAPLDHFDPLLLQCASHAWQRTARVVGEAMGRLWSRTTRSAT